MTPEEQAREIVVTATVRCLQPLGSEMIGTLRTLIAQAIAEAAPRWIPVAERLPEPGDETLLIFDGDVWAGTYASSYYGALDMEIPPRFMVGDGHKLEHVTHWMEPLPLPGQP